MQLLAHSNPDLSTWLYVPSHHCLFDAGEGLSLHLTNEVQKIRQIFLTQDQFTNTAGILNLVHARRKLVRNQPNNKLWDLTIYHHPASRHVDDLRHMVESLGRLPFRINWVRLRAEQDIPLEFPNLKPEALEHFAVQAFATSEQTYGYAIIRTAKRLKREYVGLPGPELRQLKIERGEDILDFHVEPILVVTGACKPQELPEMAIGTQVLVSDCYFQHRSREFGLNNSSLDDALDEAIEIGAQHLVGYNLSPREWTPGKVDSIFPKLRRELESKHPEVHLIDPYKAQPTALVLPKWAKV